MRAASCALAAATAIAASAIAAPAAAQSDDPRALFESGSAALEARQLDRAVRDLTRSFELAARPGTAANLAVALREARRPTEAVALFDRLLSGELGELSEDLRRALEAERAAAAAQQVTLALRSGVDVAQRVRIDEGPAFELAPRAVVVRALDEGLHVIRSGAPDHEALEVRARLAAGERHDLRLAPRRARQEASLEVVAADPAHAVEIVGVASGVGRLRERLEPGEYVLRVRGPDGATAERVQLEPGDRRRVTLEAPSGQAVVDSPWFWIVAALIVLGGAGAAVGVIVANPQREVTPVPADMVFGAVRALRF